MGNKYKVVLLAPDKNGFGGISKVVRIWSESGCSVNSYVRYISTVSDTSSYKTAHLLKALFEFLLVLLFGCDHVYVHTSSHNSFYRKSIFLAIGILLKKTIVLHIHPTHFINFLQKPDGYCKSYIQWIMNNVDTFVVINETMMAYIKENFTGKRVYLLRNPVNVEAYKNVNSVKRDCNSIIYLGWYIKEKGVYDLVDAIEILVDRGEQVHLDFYGTKNVSKLVQYVQSKNMENNICVNEWIDEAQKINELYKHALLILPSYSEGMPNVVLEAMATMTPVVSTCVGGLSELLIDNYNSVIIEPGNADDIANKIQMCLSNHELRNKLARNAYATITERYDVKVVMDDVEALMNNHVNKGSDL